MQLDLREKLGDADVNLDKALEGALHIEAVTRIEEQDNEPRVSATQENNQLVNSVNDLVRTLQINQSNRQDNQNFLPQGFRGQKKFCAELTVVQEKLEIERNRNYNSYNRSSADNRRTNYDSRVQSPTPGGEKRSRDRSHENLAEQSKTAVSVEREFFCRCGQQNQASKECKNCFECGSPNQCKRNCPFFRTS